MVATGSDAIRNAPGLLWLRARGRTVVAHLHEASSSSRWPRLLWGKGVNAVIDHFVCTTEGTRQALLASGIRDEKVTTIPAAGEPAGTHAEDGFARAWADVYAGAVKATPCV